MAYNLLFVPVSGSFDLSKVCAHLDSLPQSFQDPVRSHIYYISSSLQHAEFLREKCLDDAEYEPVACQVWLTAERITLMQERAGSGDLRTGMEFGRWLAATFDVEIKSYYGDDITEKYRAGGIEAFYSERVRAEPFPAWDGALIQIGWFHELEHCDYEGVSLERARAESAAPDEERIAAYLDAGHLYIAATGFVEDWFADDEIMIGAPHLLTDGVYVWPADLPYYVRNYHVRLPKAFMIHVANNGYEMPKDVDVTRLKLS